MTVDDHFQFSYILKHWQSSGVCMQQSQDLGMMILLLIQDNYLVE